MIIRRWFRLRLILHVKHLHQWDHISTTDLKLPKSYPRGSSPEVPGFPLSSQWVLPRPWIPLCTWIIRKKLLHSVHLSEQICLCFICGFFSLSLCPPCHCPSVNRCKNVNGWIWMNGWRNQKICLLHTFTPYKFFNPISFGHKGRLQKVSSLLIFVKGNCREVCYSSQQCSFLTFSNIFQR